MSEPNGPEDFVCDECGAEPGQLCKRAGKPPVRWTPHEARFHTYWQYRPEAAGEEGQR